VPAQFGWACGRGLAATFSSCCAALISGSRSSGALCSGFRCTAAPISGAALNCLLAIYGDADTVAW
jgi:hypothetical protein